MTTEQSWPVAGGLLGLVAPAQSAAGRGWAAPVGDGGSTAAAARQACEELPTDEIVVPARSGEG
jgi:hypothetical protein